jgi:hypothetical protein
LQEYEAQLKAHGIPVQMYTLKEATAMSALVKPFGNSSGYASCDASYSSSSSCSPEPCNSNEAYHLPFPATTSSVLFDNPSPSMDLDVFRLSSKQLEDLMEDDCCQGGGFVVSGGDPMLSSSHGLLSLMSSSSCSSSSSSSSMAFPSLGGSGSEEDSLSPVDLMDLIA